MEIVYFDNSATTRLDNNILNKMLPYLKENYGNASAVYKLGRESKKAIEDSRERVAKVLNCKASEIYFTAGGSESDNTAIRGIAHSYRNKGNHIITTQIEHLAVLETCKELEKEGFEVTYLPVDKNGTVNLEELKKAIKPSTILISIMFANNEVGTIEPIEQIGMIAKENVKINKIPYESIESILEKYEKINEFNYVITPQRYLFVQVSNKITIGYSELEVMMNVMQFVMYIIEKDILYTPNNNNNKSELTINTSNNAQHKRKKSDI